MAKEEVTSIHPSPYLYVETGPYGEPEGLRHEGRHYAHGGEHEEAVCLQRLSGEEVHQQHVQQRVDHLTEGKVV